MRMSRSEWLFLQGRGPKPTYRPKTQVDTWPATRFQEERIAASQLNDRLADAWIGRQPIGTSTGMWQGRKSPHDRIHPRMARRRGDGGGQGDFLGPHPHGGALPVGPGAIGAQHLVP